jgi:hypothetical protein
MTRPTGARKTKANAFEELRRLEHDDTNPITEKGRDVFGMKFMQDAMTRDTQHVAEAAELPRCKSTAWRERRRCVGGEVAGTDAGDIRIQRAGGGGVICVWTSRGLSR